MPNSKKTCILIDDDEDDQLIFETVLKMHFPEYQLYTFSDFENARPFIVDKAKNIDNIFIDLNMPKSNGIDCLHFLKSQSEFENIPIVIYSTSNNPDDEKRCVKNGATSFITKPSRVNDWVEKLGEFLKAKNA